ncbi:hypothetical protein FNF28_02922 [Cafeteria roenbergensis]|uniref:Uncharacterized protein n=1 Tax=Cafeteria roenbergensis TaxID=33653 RepID=A0A5A8DPA1_CAFRO|nr:hypothetical protein FNF28_02922 [Cafeteria roenbergensis]
MPTSFTVNSIQYSWRGQSMREIEPSSFRDGVITWTDSATGALAHALLEFHSDVQQLVFVELRGEYLRFGVQASLPSGYSTVMRNRALCFGSYPDVYWSECTVASRQSYAEVPALLHGEWVGNGAVSFGVAGQGRTPSCLDRLATPVQVSVGFDGIYVSRVLGAGGKGLSGEAELRTEVNLQGQRQFVSFAEETGIAITRDDQSQQLYCMALRLDGGRMELSEWTRLRDGATHNPCDPAAHRAAFEQRSPVCETNEAGDFLAGGQYLTLERAAADQAMLRISALVLALLSVWAPAFSRVGGGAVEP